MDLDTSTPHPARRYNYWLGGKDNFPADRESGDELAALHPSIRISAQENRAFLQRAVGYLAGEAGIRQFLDIGTGLPTADNTHEVAQAHAPESRIVYVDNDPLVLTHARALLTSTPEGRTAYLEADLRDQVTILREAAATLDLDRPIGLILVAVLHFVREAGAAEPIVRTLLDALPSGSYLVATHATLDFAPPATQAAFWQFYEAGQADVWPRPKEEFARLLDGLELVEPGIVPVHEWRAPAGATPRTAQEVAIWGAVARKP